MNPSPSPFPVPFSTDLSRVTTTLGVLARETVGSTWLLRETYEDSDRFGFAMHIVLEWANRTIIAARAPDEPTRKTIDALLIAATEACRSWFVAGADADTLPPTPAHPLAPWTVSFELMADTMIRVVMDTATIAASTRPRGSVDARLLGLAAGSFARATLCGVLGQFLVYHTGETVPGAALDAYLHERSKVLEPEFAGASPTAAPTAEEEMVTGYA